MEHNSNLPEEGFIAELKRRLSEDDYSFTEADYDRINERWESFPLPDRKLITALAYRLVEADENLGAAKKYEFIDLILSCVERDDPSYQKILSDALNELKKLQSNRSKLSSLNSGDIDEWLQGLTNKALEE